MKPPTERDRIFDLVNASGEIVRRRFWRHHKEARLAGNKAKAALAALMAEGYAIERGHLVKRRNRSA